ncbi:MAG TPA: DUF2723 domain-containing protein, partial [bacterium]|nr:DUF2723 domain-containing protein [bacterium]
MPLSKKTAPVLILFLAVFFVYLRTANPVFHANDSPETAACSYTLGIQHPPGYPLPTLTGKIFTFIPAGNPGFRTSLQAAFFGAMTIVLFFLGSMIMLRRKNDGYGPVLASLAAALALAFSFTLWSEALAAKGGIYTLNNFFLVLIILLLFSWEASGEKRFFYLASFSYGLSLANHWESMGVVTPALIIYVIATVRNPLSKAKLDLKMFFTAVGFGLLGPLLYLYLVIRSASDAYLNWGRPENLSALIEVVTRGQYADLEKARGIEVVMRQVKKFISLFTFEFTAWGAALSTAGAYSLVKRAKKNVFLLFSALIVTVFLALSFYFNLKEEMLWIMDVFMIPVYAAAAYFAAAGILYIADRAKKFKLPVLALFFALPVYLFAANYGRADQSRYFFGYDLGKNIIRCIELPAIAMLEGDFNVMPMMYFKYV